MDLNKDKAIALSNKFMELELVGAAGYSHY